jgi:F-type H+-transporting ATPase subunit epsilon
MLPEAINLDVVTPERRVVQEVVDEVQIPGSQGYLGVLPGHAPLMTLLAAGVLSYRTGAHWHYLAAIGGFAEIQPDRVIILAERCERAEEIDVERARAAEQRARQRLSRLNDPDVDWQRASAALERAMVRLQVAALGKTTQPLTPR